jgi:hypothetical protein
VRVVAILVLCSGSVAGLLFIGDYVRGARGLGVKRSTARDILVSAMGICGLVIAFLADAVFRIPQARWALSVAVGLLATIMYPIWWLKMRRLRSRPDTEGDT